MRIGNIVGALGVAATAALGFATASQAAPVPSEFTLSGDIATPGVYNLTALSALPATTQTVTYTSGGTPVTDTYTGTNLWTLLNAAGGPTPVPGAKNSTLRNYVVAVGSDGYQAVFSGGEIDPKFGNQPVNVAYADTAGQLGAGGSQGFARMVVPGDTAGGRYVSNIVDLHVGTAPSFAGTGGGISNQFVLSGAVVAPGVYGLADLQSLPATTLTATYLAGGSPVTDTYTGVSLWTFLTSVGLVTNPANKNDILRKYVVAVGSDGYEAIFSLGEIAPQFGNEPDLIAYADTAGQLGINGTDGFARLVVPGDGAGGRYVSNLVALAVIDATVPEPTGISLLIAGLLALVALRLRRVVH